MSDGFKKRKKALEEGYFQKEQAKALEKLANKASAKMSPVNGKPMRTVMYENVEIDICEESGGMWLDQGELEKIISNITTKGYSSTEEDEGLFSDFKKLLGL